MAREIYKCKCGTPTFDEAKVCIFCKAKDREEAPVVLDAASRSSDIKEETIVPKFNDKTCECGKTFTPGGPRQKFCKDCQKKPKGGRKTPPRRATPTAASQKPRTPLLKPAEGKHPSDNGGTYLIPLDFTQYPLLHEKLIKEAEKDFRPPELEALFLLNNTFESIELALEKAEQS